MSGRHSHWNVYQNPQPAELLDEVSAETRENEPSVVLREIGLVLGGALTIAFAVNVLLVVLHIS